MSQQTLHIDGKNLARKQYLKATRPVEHWIVLLKKEILSPKWRLNISVILSIIFRAFVICVLFAFFRAFSRGGLMDISLIVFAIVLISLTIRLFTKSIFWDANTITSNSIYNNSFNQLVGFLIAIKGDLKENKVQIRLNKGRIFKKVNKLKLEDLNLTFLPEGKLRLYQMERFKMKFILKDGTLGSISMQQLALNITTTKVRASGKTKTKTKEKHRFQYTLVLRFKKGQYDIQEPLPFNNEKTPYRIAIHRKPDFDVVRVKMIDKIGFIAGRASRSQANRNSIFEHMMNYLLQEQIIRPNASTKNLKIDERPIHLRDSSESDLS